jgi:hypothetical protein
MNTNEIKEHFPLLYDILVQRANKVIELNQRTDGIHPDKAEAFLSGKLTCINNLICWHETPEDHDFWERLNKYSYSEVKDKVIYENYKTPIVSIHDLWI